MIYIFAMLLKMLLPALLLVTGYLAVRDIYNRRSESKSKDSYASPADTTFSNQCRIYFSVLFFVYAVRSMLYEPSQIPSESMQPTLQIGDYILIDKHRYSLRDPLFNFSIVQFEKPHRGDVVVFYSPKDPEVYFIKRIIGVPGDLINYTNHQLSINGIDVPTSLLSTKTINDVQVKFERETIGQDSFITQKNVAPGALSKLGSWTVPDGYYFVMGDNRDHSDDSRDWGFVKNENIVGKASYVWMHWESVLSLPKFEFNREIH